MEAGGVLGYTRAMRSCSSLHRAIVGTFAASLVLGLSASSARADSQHSPELARKIQADKSLDDVLRRSKALLQTGFNAGSGYREVWIRDYATFIELACQVHEAAEIQENLLMFFRLQGDDGNIIDGFVPRERANVGYDYIKKPSVPDYWGHKNTVETDQESSLVQAVATYVRATGDQDFPQTEVDGRTVLERLEAAMKFLREERWDDKHGLLWGATTVDWGDVQPEHSWGVELDENSHLAIDIYDNALFLLALQDLVELLGDDRATARPWIELSNRVARKVREHLWDAERQKYIPHVYLDGSPFPSDWDESQVYYHGGTAIAILAGLLEPDEIRASLEQMRDNVRACGAGSIGLTVYPPYPAGLFKNRSMRPYGYQNGGDWTWFGGRMIHALIEHDLIEDAYKELRPMIDRVIENDGFYEWYDIYNKPRGSGTFRGEAGVLGKAILMLRAWADSTLKAHDAARRDG